LLILLVVFVFIDGYLGIFKNCHQWLCLRGARPGSGAGKSVA
jgi:hypothetical protein